MRGEWKGWERVIALGRWDGVGVDPWNFFWWPQYKCTPLLSLSAEHITVRLMLWHLGFGNYSLLRRTLPRNKCTNYSRKAFASFFSVLFSHIHLLSLLAFFFFLLPSFSCFFDIPLFLSSYMCNFCLFVGLFVCHFLTFLSLHRNGIPSSLTIYGIFLKRTWNLSLKGKWTDCHKSLLVLFLSVDC